MNLSNINFVKIRSNPRGISRLDLFERESFVGIGFPGIGPVDGLTKDEIKRAIKEKYPDRKPVAVGLITGFFETLLALHEGDYVFVPYSENAVRYAAVFRVKGKYQFKEQYTALDVAHTIPADYIRSIPLDTMSEKLKKSLGSMASVSRLNAYSDELFALLENKKISSLVEESRISNFIFREGAKRINLSFNDDVKKEDLIAFINQVLPKMKQ